MIVCAQCGESNAPDSEFCGACGTYLEWEPKPAPQPVPGQAGQGQAGQGQVGQGQVGQGQVGQGQVGQGPVNNQPMPWPLPPRGGPQSGPPYQPGPPPGGPWSGHAGPPGQGPGHPAPGRPGAGQSGAGYPSPGQSGAGYPPPGQSRAGYPAAGQSGAGYAAAGTGGYPTAGQSGPGFPPAGPPGAQQAGAQQPGAQQPGVMQPGPQQPGAMQPADQKPTKAANRPRLTERRVAQPGDLICGQCGEANPPSRKFCARCGSALVEAEVVAEKWWRRLRPKRKPPAAGTRPSRHRGAARRGIGRAVRWSFLIALVGAVAAYGLVPSFRGLVNTQATSVAKDVKGVFVTELTPVRPTGISATAESPDHPPLLAADNAKNTFWLAPAEPRQPALVLDFGREVDLREAIVRVGNPDDFQAAHRPKKLHLVYSTGKTFDLDIADTPDEQKVKIENSGGATKVEVHVVELHRSLQGNEVALAEIEFFAVR